MGGGGGGVGVVGGLVSRWAPMAGALKIHAPMEASWYFSQ